MPQAVRPVVVVRFVLGQGAGRDHDGILAEGHGLDLSGVGGEGAAVELVVHAVGDVLELLHHVHVAAHVVAVQVCATVPVGRLDVLNDVGTAGLDGGQEDPERGQLVLGQVRPVLLLFE